MTHLPLCKVLLGDVLMMQLSTKSTCAPGLLVMDKERRTRQENENVGYYGINAHYSAGYLTFPTEEHDSL